MQVVILSGGKGTRLYPYTAVMPKPLVPVGDLPILEVVIRQLKHYKVKEIIISTGHLAGLIEAYFKDGGKWGVKIRYVREDRPLGTAGAIKNISGLEENFIVMNGDVLTTIDYAQLFNYHLRHKAAATISIIKKEVLIDFGVIKIDENSQLTDYIEKPKHFNYVSMGIYVLSKKCRNYISRGEHIDIPQLILKLNTQKERVFCYQPDCYWLDIGRIEDFQKAQDEFTKSRKKFLYEEKE